MNGMRKWFCLLVGVVFAAFALPSSATKLVSLTVSVTDVNGNDTGGVIPSGANSMVLLDFKNQTPPTDPANSVINWVQVPFPLTGDPTLQYIVKQTTTANNGKTCPASPLPNPADTPTGTATLTFNNIIGAKIGGHFCAYLEVTTSLPACTLTTWKGFAQTGSSGNAQPFFDVANQNNIYVTGSTYDGCDGTLACGDDLGFIKRGLDWGTSPAGNCSARIDYDFDFDPNTDVTASFITIKNGQNFTVQYSLTWNPVLLSSVDTIIGGVHDGFPVFRPRVSYGVTNPDPNSQYDFYELLACKSGPDVLDPGFNPNAVMPTLPNILPFNDPNQPYTQYKYGIDPDTGVLRKAKVCLELLDWVTLPGGKVQERALIIDQSDTTIRP